MQKKLAVFLIILATLSFSGQLFANGLSLNSIGTRALGMGGAMVGLADDRTAIYWNPAGLTGQPTGVDFFITDIIPSATYKLDALDIDAKSKTNHYAGPNLFMNYNMGEVNIGLGVYVPSGLGVEWDKEDFGFETMSKIGVFSFSPTVSYMFNRRLSIGASANVYYGMMEMKRGAENDLGGMSQYSEELTGTGLGLTVGIKYNAAERLSLGLTYRTPVEVAFEGEADLGFYIDVKRDIEWPAWLGFGLAYRVNEKWLITLDGQYSDWSSLERLISKSTFFLPGTGIISQEDTTQLNWESKLQVRLGMEYKLNERLALRCGYYYDPAPAPDETLNILFPSSTNHVLTGGLGYRLGRWHFNGAMEYLFGAERDIEMDPDNAQPGIHQMDIFAFSVGFGYAF